MMCSSMAAPDNLTNSKRPFQTAFFLLKWNSVLKHISHETA